MRSDLHMEVLHTDFWVAPGRVYTTETTTASRRVYTPQGPELHLVLSENRSLCCSLTYLHTKDSTALWCVYTVQACTAPRVVYTTVQDLSCTWTCLASSSLCCFYWGVSITGTWAPDGGVCITESCAAHGWVSSTVPWAALGSVYTLGPKFHQDVSALQSLVLLSDQSTHWGLSITWMCLQSPTLLINCEA